jgi:gas vesicle protein
MLGFLIGLLTLGFLPGKLRFLALGLAVGLLTAPRSGAESRRLLQENFR